MKTFLSLIKFSHTIFAMPFALLGFFLGVHTAPEGFSWRVFILVILCMVFARSAAMAFNRYTDRHIDLANPRTRHREIPSGMISARRVLFLVLANVLLFVFCAWLINPLCFALSPVALAVILGYSYTKRFTWLSHMILGLGLALAPIGAYIAVTSAFALLPILYGLVVLLWVGGFDIIYALQDVSFDKQQDLLSVPVRFGARAGLWISTGLHMLCGAVLVFTHLDLARHFPQLLWLHWTGLLIFLGLLAYQHMIVKPQDLSRVNIAFFTTNGIASLIFGVLVILDFYI